MIMMVVSAFLKYALGLYKKAIIYYKLGCKMLLETLQSIVLYQSFIFIR